MTATRRIIGLLIALPVVVAAMPTSADSKDDQRTRKLMHDYARCVIRSSHDQAAEAILSNADNSTIMKRYSGLVNGECLGRIAPGAEMRFGGDLYRYALADALVSADYAASGESDFSNRLPLAHLPMREHSELDASLASIKSARRRKEAEDSFSKANGVAWLSRYGECVARASPVKARLWLLTPPDTPEETSRINDMRPAFSRCLGDGTLKFNRITIRGTVAINYYRLARATARPIAGKAL